MANLLDRFNSEVVASDDILRDFLPVIAPKGDFKRVRDLNVILNSWNNILLTPRRTYLHDPEFGSDLYKYVFEPSDQISIEGIKTEVVTRIETYDNRAAVEDVDVITAKDGKVIGLDILVNYRGEKRTLEVSFDDETFVHFLERVPE